MQLLRRPRPRKKTQEMSKNIAAGVYKAQDSPPFSQEAPQHSDLSRTTREQRYDKDYGERTPPILQFLDECNTVSDVAALVAATEPPPSVPLASSMPVSTSQAPNPSLGSAARDTATGGAHRAFQPDPGHVRNDGQVREGLDAAPPTSLTAAATVPRITVLRLKNPICSSGRKPSGRTR